MLGATISDRKFIVLVNTAYPEVAEKPIFRESQVELLWRVLRVLDHNPAILSEKSVRHNLSGPKLVWLERLAANMEGDPDGTV